MWLLIDFLKMKVLKRAVLKSGDDCPKAEISEFHNKAFSVNLHQHFWRFQLSLIS